MSSGEPDNEDRGTDSSRDLPELDFDAAFAALVARFGDPPADDPLAGPGPDPDTAAEPAPERGADAGDPQTAKPARDAPERWYPAELDEHYEPPEPPPIPRGDLVSRLAWSGVLGGPAMLMIAAVVHGALPSWMVVGALLSFVAGFATLVARMPAERPDDGDDGAVV